MPKTDQAELTITEVEQRSGITASVLRIWERRYGWPRPTRAANGYRRYPATLVGILVRVRQELQTGKAIGDLMANAWWQQVFESGFLPEPPPRPVRPQPKWNTIPQPQSTLGRDIRTRLEKALMASDHSTVDLVQALSLRLHPTEREHAVDAVMRLWNEHRPPS